MARIDSYENFLTDMADCCRKICGGVTVDGTITKRYQPAEMDTVLYDRNALLLDEISRSYVISENPFTLIPGNGLDIIPQSNSTVSFPLMLDTNNVFIKIEEECLRQMLDQIIAVNADVDTSDYEMWPRLMYNMDGMIIGNNVWANMDFQFQIENSNIKWPKEFTIPRGTFVFADREYLGALHINDEITLNMLDYLPEDWVVSE